VVKQKALNSLIVYIQLKECLRQLNFDCSGLSLRSFTTGNIESVRKLVQEKLLYDIATGARYYKFSNGMIFGNKLPKLWAFYMAKQAIKEKEVDDTMQMVMSLMQSRKLQVSTLMKWAELVMDCLANVYLCRV
jgi:hypothetical protein